MLETVFPPVMHRLLLVSTLALVGLSCQPDGDRTNVVLVSIDTLRPDHLGCYGYHLETSPNIDAFCSESVVFREAIAHAPSTLPSHASILTSLLPAHHRASFADRTPLPEGILTLGEVLRRRGYRTASFNGGGQISPEWGLDQGFEVYESRDGSTFSEIVDAAAGWLQGRRAASSPDPFFLFLHSYEVHSPYSPAPEDLARFSDRARSARFGRTVEPDELDRLNRGPRPIDDAIADFILASYDAEIRSMDRAFGRLLQILRRLGLDASTVVIFTSDHGEEFGEHGRYGWHSHTLYDELLRVPLVIRWPDRRLAGTTARTPVRSIDIAPTVLATLGLRSPDQFTGVDLLEVLRDQNRHRLLAVSQRDLPRADRPASLSIRSRRWKLFDGRLFDLETDPGETENVAPGHWDLVRELQDRLDRILDSRDPPEASPITLDRDAQRRLEALGYL